MNLFASLRCRLVIRKPEWPEAYRHAAAAVSDEALAGPRVCRGSGGGRGGGEASWLERASERGRNECENKQQTETQKKKKTGFSSRDQGRLVGCKLVLLARLLLWVFLTHRY